MHKIKGKLWWILASVAVALIFLLPVFVGDYRDYLTEILNRYPAFAPVIIIASRFITAILAPLPAMPIALASMVFMPWHVAWFYNLIGMELGSISAFFIARKFRQSVVSHFAPFARLHTWQNKISERKQFFAFAGLRIASLVIFDFVSYAAGLSTLRFRVFLIVSFVMDAFFSLIFFYIGGLAFEYSFYMFLLFAAVFGISIWFLSKKSNEAQI